MANLRPAQPPVVKPPIMMMRDKWYLLVAANPREMPSKEEVASDAEIVSPDEAIVRVHSGEKPCQRCPDALFDFFRPMGLFRNVLPGRFDQQAHGGRFESVTKELKPIRARSFAARQRDLDTFMKQPDDVRYGELDDPSDAAGAQMIMTNDQMQDAGNF